MGHHSDSKTYKQEFFDREYSAKEAYGRLWGYTRKYRFRICFGILCGMLTAGTLLPIFQVIQPALDKVGMAEQGAAAKMTAAPVNGSVAKAAAVPVKNLAKPVGRGVPDVSPKPPPVVKPPLIVPEPSPEKPKAEESSGGILSMIVPPVFKKKAKLVIPPGHGAADVASASPHKSNPSPVLELPKNLQIGRMGDSVKDLKALESLPGYVKGGPVSSELSPYKIAGAAWKSPATYYYLRGKITPGDKIDEKSIESGTLIFYKASTK